jgi:hypothetical protein
MPILTVLNPLHAWGDLPIFFYFLNLKWLFPVMLHEFEKNRARKINFFLWDQIELIQLKNTGMPAV